MAPASIHLTVPGTLAHRGIAVRVVAEACRLVSAPHVAPAADVGAAYDLRDPFDAAVVSAFAEIFNNIVLHAYGGGAASATIDLVISTAAGAVVIEIRDHGAPFDLTAVPAPALDALPEGGMGIHIAKTMLDDMTYAPGPPNRWRLHKAYAPTGRG